MHLNVPNRSIFCKDNLEIMKGINSKYIDLIYLDPPFNKKKIFTAPIGSSAEGANFKDWFKEEDIKDEWIQTIKEDHVELYNFLNGVKAFGNQYNYCYLVYMAIRLLECHRILKDTGSIYLHCDPTMSHYIKLLLDNIFGEKNFRNEIIWCYKSGGSSKKNFSKKHDVIFFYSKAEKWNFNYLEEKSYGVTGGGQQGKVKYYKDNIGNYSIVGLKDWWIISMLSTTHPERTGYPTQKPIKLLERIIKASSNEKDIILDPFCGCATTCIAAEKLNRQWIGIDVSIKAYELVKKRLKKEVTSDLFIEKDLIFNTDPPKRTDIESPGIEKKYVYVISNKSYTNEYKVGIAKNYKSRLNSYQIGDPDRAYKVEFTLLTEKYREIEKYIHHKFNNKHEWVNGSLKDIIDEIKKQNVD